MTLSVVHVVRQYAPSVGGLEAVVSQLAKQQVSRLGHDVRVVTLDRVFREPQRVLPAREMIDGVAVVRLPWRGSSRYPICPSVLSALGDADIVHVHAIDFFFDFLAATRWLHRKTLVASTHGGFFHTGFMARLKRAWFQGVTRLSATAYRRIVADSDSDGATFDRIARSRVSVIENGVELERYRDAASREAVPTLIYFGRWSVNKGLPRLVELLAALRARDARFRLIIAGRPYDLSAVDLVREAEACHVTDAVEIHAAPSDAELRSLIGRATYVACLSSYEGFGVAAIEGMSAGLLPVLSDIPTFRKLVSGSRIGRLIGDDLAASAAAIVRDHARDGAVHAAERAGAIAFAQRYEWGAVADRFETVYREALAARCERTVDHPSEAPR